MADVTTPDGLVGNPNAAAVTPNLTGNTPAGTFMGASSSVAQNADYVGNTNITQVGSDIVRDPAGFLGSEGTLSDNVPTIDPNTAGTNVDKNAYNMDTDALNVNASTAGISQAGQITKPTTAPTYTAATTSSQINALANANNAVTGTVDQNELVNVPTLDMGGLATGTNADGSTNAVGQALNTVYTQNLSTIVDTNTVAGKLLAQSLGEGNYTDAKTQITYWMDTLSKDFVDPQTGQPKIPTWAAGALKGVNRMIALKGVTGTAALSAVASATMESILPIAMESSKFFQTMTAKNMDAKNARALQTAQILSNMNLADMDARMTQAVTNAKTFMQMDLTNLANEQQTALVEFQAKQQSILEDANQTNVARRFAAENQTQVDQFYTQLGTQIDQFNVSQKNAMEQFNTGQVNDFAKFNSELENSREQFYMNFQYGIDAANAKWRQTVTLTENQMIFDAAATDVKNIVGLTSEQLNQMWDRSDALLDYSWKEAENQKDRNVQIQVAKLNYDAQIAAANAKKGGIGGALGSIFGSVAGGFAGTEVGAAAIAGMFSDRRLKTNLQAIDVLENGITVYSWEWNEEAKRIGADKQENFGVVAQEVAEIIPAAVSMDKSGYLKVDYRMVMV